MSTACRQLGSTGILHLHGNCTESTPVLECSGLWLQSRNHRYMRTVGLCSVRGSAVEDAVLKGADMAMEVVEDEDAVLEAVLGNLHIVHCQIDRRLDNYRQWCPQRTSCYHRSRSIQGMGSTQGNRIPTRTSAARTDHCMSYKLCFPQ